MKILITFEHGAIAIHSVDFLRMLKSRGHSLYFLKISTDNLNDPHGWIAQSCTILTHLTNVNQYDMWLYDVTSWDLPRSPLNTLFESYTGKLACINYEDGYGFFLNRVSDAVVDKTLFFMNNTLRTDITKYDTRVRSKLVLSTSYISNSQDFKKMSVAFRNKNKRAIFTGSITGFSESGDPEELKCRIKVPMALINAGIPCFYKIYNSDPGYKSLLKEVPDEYITSHLPRQVFLSETVNSMIILSLKGNGYTVNRFFEGLASGGLVFSTKFQHAANFIGCGIAGTHYVEIMWDGSDVVEKFNYYINNIEEAERIAVNGRKLWEEYSMLDVNNILPTSVIDNIVSQIRNISGVEV